MAEHALQHLGLSQAVESFLAQASHAAVRHLGRRLTTTLHHLLQLGQLPKSSLVRPHASASCLLCLQLLSCLLLLKHSLQLIEVY